MRILACSDVHGHVEDVVRLRDLESNRFDAVVMAGDMNGLGEQANVAGEMLRLLGSFGCPVVFVLGNWDKRIEYCDNLFQPAHHLQAAPVVVEGFCFIGYSGCHEGWGGNPVARECWREVEERHPQVSARLQAIRQAPWSDRTKEEQRTRLKTTPEWGAYAADVLALRQSVPQRNADQAMAKAAETGVPTCRTVFVSHARTMRLQSRYPGTRLNLFGHLHGFWHTHSAGMDSINVSALDRRRLAMPAEDPALQPCTYREEHCGTYTVIELTKDAVFATGIKLLGDDENSTVHPFR